MFSSHTMSTDWSPPKTTNIARPGGLIGSQQRPDANVGPSGNNARNAPSRDTQFGEPPNEIHPPPCNSNLLLRPPFPGAPLFYHPAPFNMTRSLQPSSGGATHGYQSCGPSWQGYDIPQGGYGGPQMYPRCRNSPDRGIYLQVHLECLQHRLETIKSLGRHSPPLLHTH